MKGKLDLNVDIGSINLKNPVMTASGTFGYGIEFAPVVDLSLLGAVVVKGISLEPRQGNPQHKKPHQNHYQNPNKQLPQSR